MKDQPPEPGRRTEPPIRRFETNLALLLVTTLAAAYLLVERAASGASHAALTDLPTVPMSAVYAGVAIAGTLILNFLFVRSETSLELLKPHHLKQLRETHPARADLLAKLLEHRARNVAACNLGSQICRVVLVVVSFAIAPGLAAILADRFGVSYHYGTVVFAAVLLMIPIGLLNLVLGELVPKNLGALYPDKVTRLARFVRFAGLVFAPLAGLSTWVANIFTARHGAKATFDVAHQAEEEIKTLVETAQESGAIEEEEREMLHSVFEFTDTVAREVMTPRVDLDAVSIQAPADEVIKVIQESGHSRIPIYEDTDDQIIGIIHAKDLLLASVERGGEVSIRELMRPAFFVPENKNLHELLSEMRMGRSQLAVVQDEFGGTAGIVTIEDIVEELVGDIQDEYDEEDPPIVGIDGGHLIDGKTHLDEVNEVLGTELESEVFDTIGGFVFGLFGRQPAVGESIEAEGYAFTVVETDGRRVGRLRAEPGGDDSAAGEVLTQGRDAR